MRTESAAGEAAFAGAVPEVGSAPEIPASARLLLVDPVGGVSGDMFLAAFLDLGLPRERLEENLTRIGLGRLFGIEYGRTRRHGLAAGRVEFPALPEARRRPAPKSLAANLDYLRAAGLASGIFAVCEKLFTSLAAAEARVHGTTVERIHFHEVGAYDTLADFVGLATALAWYRPARVHLGAIPLGRGGIDCAHGRLPLPGPAAAILLEGLAVWESGIAAELTTPTGAAICRYLHDSFPRLPAGAVFRSLGCGWGAGQRDLAERPNLLRLRLGRLEPGNGSADADPAPAFEREEVVVLETLIDDLSPEKLAALAETLRAAGALEVVLRPVVMKKGRPGSELLLLAEPAREGALVELLFRLSSTLGIRRRRQPRYRLERRVREFATTYGRLRGKTACDRRGRCLNFKFEHDDLAARARERGCSIAELETLARAELLREKFEPDI